jgi:hypothetical protein
MMKCKAEKKLHVYTSIFTSKRKRRGGGDEQSRLPAASSSKRLAGKQPHGKTEKDGVSGSGARRPQVMTSTLVWHQKGSLKCSHNTVTHVAAHRMQAANLLALFAHCQHRM